MSNNITKDLQRNFQNLVQKFLWDPEPKNTDLMNNIWLLGAEYPPSSSSVPLPSPSASPASPPAPPPHAAINGDDDADADASGDADDQYDKVERAEKPQRPEDSAAASTWPAAFLDDFESRIWMTYRSEFAPIPRSTEPGAAAGLTMFTSLRSHLPQHQSGFTDDAGWGCMIRSAQCVLANALLTLRLGRDWRRGMKPDEEKKLLALFADDPRAPFGIHAFVQHGEVCGTSPGQWFGPNAASRCIQALTHNYPDAGLRVYLARDGGDVYMDSFREVAEVNGEFRPTLVLAPHRLGISGVTDVYREALKAVVQMRQSVGIAGGRPSSSHYFIGVQGDYLFYLDPHTCRPLLPFKEDPTGYTKEEVDTCHTRRLRRLDVKDMDPSMLIAFLIRDEKDWKEWREGVKKVQGKPIIHVFDKEPTAHGHTRPEAVAEVEALEDSDDELDGSQ